MIKIRLSAEDAESLGVPRELAFSESSFRLKEARQLERETGFTLQALKDGLSGGDINALAALAWFVVVRAGRMISFEDFDIDLMGMDVESDGGKAMKPN